MDYKIFFLLAVVFLAGCASQPSNVNEGNKTSSIAATEPTEEQITYFAPVNYKLDKTSINTSHKMMSDRMRWNSSTISYYSKINESVNAKVIKNAIDIWNKESNGIIKFVEVDAPEKANFVIRFAKGGEFSEQPASKLIIVVLGEAQLDILDTGLFNLTKSAEVIYTPTSGGCEDNITAIHELGHVLGFAHTSDVNSVMFNSVDCKGKITNEMKQSLDALYSIKEFPDLYFGPMEIKKIGTALDINVSIANRGLITSKPVIIDITVDGKFVGTKNVPSIEAGKDWGEKFNVDVGVGFNSIELEIDKQNVQEEFDKENNKINLVEVSKPVLQNNIIDYKLDERLREDFLLYGNTVVTLEYNNSCEECLWQKSYLESFAKKTPEQIILEIIENNKIETSNVTIESKRGLTHKTTATLKYTGVSEEAVGPYKISEAGRTKRQIYVTFENRSIVDPSEIDINADLCKLILKVPDDCKIRK